MSRNERICKAIRENKVLEFFYDGHRRVVEPVKLGNAADNGNIILIGYQVGGYSESSKMPPWRRFEAHKIRNLSIREENSLKERGEVDANLKTRNNLCQDHP